MDLPARSLCPRLVPVLVLAGALLVTAPAPALGATPSPAATISAVLTTPAPTPVPEPTSDPQSVSEAPEPVIDRAPDRVRLGRTAIVAGHVDDGTPGSSVVIERRYPEHEWAAVGRRALDEENRVRFVLENRRTSAYYRLRYDGDGTYSPSYSDAVKIAVRSHLTLRVSPRSPYRGGQLRLRGLLRPAVPGRRVVVEQRSHGDWVTIGRSAAGDGDFAFSLYLSSSRDRVLRVRFPGDARNTSALRARIVRVFEPDLATWYGPGFYGNGTACGQRLDRGTMGVAHRSLPCGTEVTLNYRGRTVTVAVIDRGPYSAAEWDLTQATAERLGFSGSNYVGTDH